jgi:hypothetical protein
MDYELFNKAIRLAKRYALDYYGGNEEDANDMLEGIKLVKEYFNQLIKQA